MAPLLYTSTIAEKLYSCDENGAHMTLFQGEDQWVDTEGMPRGIPRGISRGISHPA